MAKRARKTKRILVVDDEPLVCDSVKMMLASDGHTVETANSSEEALAAFAKGRFDLVIIDYVMPAVRGDELAARMKAQVPTQPVAMITAHAEVLDLPANPLARADFVIVKPFMLEQLREVMDKLAPRA